jgi:hypothetical protein
VGDFYLTKVVKTRKPHVCGMCDSTVPKGLKAEYVSGRYEESWVSYYLCPFCLRYIDVMNPDLSDGFSGDFLSDDLAEIGIYDVDIMYNEEKVFFSDSEENTYLKTWDEFFLKI